MAANSKRRPQPAKQGATKKHIGADGSAPAPSVGQRLLRTKQAAHYIGVSTRTLWSLASLRRIPTVRFNTGGRESVRFDIVDLDSWIDAQKNSGRKGNSK